MNYPINWSLRKLCFLDDEIQQLSPDARWYIVQLYENRKRKKLPQPDWKGRGWQSYVLLNEPLYNAICIWFAFSCDGHKS